MSFDQYNFENNNSNQHTELSTRVNSDMLNMLRDESIDTNPIIDVTPTVNNTPIRVENVSSIDKDSEKSAKEAKAWFIGSTVAAVAVAIILSGYMISNKIKKDNSENINTDNPNTIEKVIDEDVNVETNNDNEATVEVSTSSETTVDITDNIDYSNVSSFFSHISENRSKYGTFAESFQSEEDVKNFINFFYKFDDMYDFSSLTSTISSEEQFDEIVRDYYKSCVSHSVDSRMNTIFKSGTVTHDKIKESEDLANNLRNGSGTDYTISNNYYTWFGKNLCDDRTRINVTEKNAPLIELLRTQFEEHRYVGNMLNARKYQKNDSLPIENKDVYYAQESPEGAVVEEVNNAFSCPDWGIDNVVSRYEENTETKLVIKDDQNSLFYTVDEAFTRVLSNGVTRN